MSTQDVFTHGSEKKLLCRDVRPVKINYPFILCTVTLNCNTVSIGICRCSACSDVRPVTAFHTLTTLPCCGRACLRKPRHIFSWNPFFIQICPLITTHPFSKVPGEISPCLKAILRNPDATVGKLSSQGGNKLKNRCQNSCPRKEILGREICSRNKWEILPKMLPSKGNPF